MTTGHISIYLVYTQFHDGGRTFCINACCIKINVLRIVIRTFHVGIYIYIYAYMKLADPFPCARALKTLLCSVSNKGQLQNLICSSYLTDVAQRLMQRLSTQLASNANVSTQQPCKTTTLTSFRLILSSSPLTQFCTSQTKQA